MYLWIALTLKQGDFHVTIFNLQATNKVHKVNKIGIYRIARHIGEEYTMDHLV